MGRFRRAGVPVADDITWGPWGLEHQHQHHHSPLPGMGHMAQNVHPLLLGIFAT